MRFAGEGGGMKKNGFKRGLTSRLLVYVKPYRGYVVGAAICSLLYVAFVLLGPVLYGWAIDAMIGAGQVDFTKVFYMSGGFALCVLLAFASQKLLNNFVNSLCYKLVRDLREDAFYSLSAAPVRYADTHAQGDVMARVVNDVDIISDGLLQGVAQLFTGVTTILGTLVVMFVINYIIALVVVLLTPLSLFVAAAITKKTFRLFQKQMRIQGELTAHTKEMFGGQKTVILFNEEEYSEKKFEAINARLNEIGWRAQYASALTNPSTRFVNAVIYAVVGVLGAVFCILSATNGGVLRLGALTLSVSDAMAYEYARKEFASGKTMAFAVKAGYKKCFWHIFDAHIVLAALGFITYFIALTELSVFAFTLGIAMFFAGLCTLAVDRFCWYIMMPFAKDKAKFCRFKREEVEEDD